MDQTVPGTAIIALGAVAPMASSTEATLATTKRQRGVATAATCLGQPNCSGQVWLGEADKPTPTEIIGELP